MNSIFGLLYGVAASVLGWYVTRFLSRGEMNLKMKARARAEAAASRLRNAASGIKGDGFSALFHLHRALHYRIRSVGWIVIAATWFLCVIFTSSVRWWYSVPFFLALQYSVFRASYLGAQAAAMVEVAEEAVKKSAGEADGAVMDHVPE